MKKKILSGTRQYQIGEQSLLVLKYYMVEKPINPGENYYGVEINQQRLCNGVESTVDYHSLLLSASKTWVEALIDTFIGNGVTPSTMEYIIDDIMGIPC